MCVTLTHSKMWGYVISGLISRMTANNRICSDIPNISGAERDPSGLNCRCTELLEMVSKTPSERTFLTSQLQRFQIKFYSNTDSNSVITKLWRRNSDLPLFAKRMAFKERSCFLFLSTVFHSWSADCRSLTISLEYQPAPPGGSAVSIQTHSGHPWGCLETYAVIDRVLQGKCSWAYFKENPEYLTCGSLGRKHDQTLAAGEPQVASQLCLAVSAEFLLFLV